MKMKIHADKVDISDAIKNYIETKLARLDRYFKDDSVEAIVKVRLRGIEQIIEVTVPTKKFTLRAEENHKELRAAIDLVVDKLERQIRKNKTRLNKRYKSVDTPDFTFDYEVEEENTEKIVKRKDIASKPMDEEEAILQMELLNHDFFAFKNVDEDCISVVYKRKDGHYGLMNVK